MDTEKIEIVLEESTVGPVADYMLDYSDRDFETYVFREMSDGTRRHIATKSAEFADTISQVFGKQAVKSDFTYLRDDVIAARKVTKEPFSDSEPPSDFEHGKFRPPVANFSGPEFFDLTKVAITLGGSALTVAMVKAIKDIIIAWIKARAARKLTIKVGSNTLTIQGTTSEKEVETVVHQLEKIATIAKPPKEKTAKEKPSALEKPQPPLALPPPQQDAQPTAKTPRKRKVRQKQQS